jgi:hypothetical protein
MKFGYAFSLSAAALIISGCFSSGSAIGPAAVPDAVAVPSRAAAQTSGDLLYISTGRDEEILTYPKAKLLATFGYGNAGLCSDKKGNVYTTIFHGVKVYKHGATTPFRTLTLSYDFPEDCSVDPTTGDLAVAIACISSCYTSVVVFRHARGTGKAYAAGLLGQNCGYDNKGNLFVSGSSGGAQFVELPKGSNTFTPISFEPPIGFAGGRIQWDGHYLAIGDPGGSSVTPSINQVTISGSAGTVVGNTPLNGAYNAFGEWIDGERVIVPFISSYYGASRVGYWKYPEGGTPEKILLNRRYRFRFAISVTVSAAPNRR